MYRQSTLAGLLLVELRPYVFWWLDDLIIHASTVKDHLKAVSMFLKILVHVQLQARYSKVCLTRHLCPFVGTNHFLLKKLSFDPDI